MIVLAIDPGYVQSAWVAYNTETKGIRGHAIDPNESLLRAMRIMSTDVAQVVIEQVASYGMAVGREVFETVYWSGRFAEAADSNGIPVGRITRLDVKLALCHDSRAKDANVRQAVIDRYGGKDAIGTKRSPGMLYGVKADIWAALAVAIAWGDRDA